VYILESDTVTRYLRVNLTNNLSWNIHVDKITKKANSTLGFLHRNLRISNTSVKSNAYTSLVRPHLEYCSPVWSPYIKNLTNKVEMVQRWAAIYATNRYHNTSSATTTMLDQLDWETLEDRRTIRHSWPCSTGSQMTLLIYLLTSTYHLPTIPPDRPIPGNTNNPLHLHPTTETLFFSLRLWRHGTTCLHPSQRPPPWYPSRGGCPYIHSKRVRAQAVSKLLVIPWAVSAVATITGEAWDEVVENAAGNIFIYFSLLAIMLILSILLFLLLLL